MEFEYSRWSEELREAIDGYSAICDPIILSNSLEKYYKSSRIIELVGLGFEGQQKEKGIIVAEQDIKKIQEKYINQFVNEGKKGVVIYKRQMIIVIVTIIEAMIKNFISSYFYNNPISMYEYVGEAAIPAHGVSC